MKGEALPNKRPNGASTRVKKLAYGSLLLLLALFFGMQLFYNQNMISAATAEYAQTVIFSLLLSVFAICFMFYRGIDPRSLVDSLGLSKRHLTYKNLGIGILVLLMVLIFEVGSDVVAHLAGISLNTNVDLIFSSAPIWLLLFTFSLGPLNEEIFFRAFLVPRIGIIFSAAIFALLHASYDSTFAIEVIAAFFFATISGYVYKKTGSLYPSLLAHILINLLTILPLL